jgi:hypothetical protein
LRTLFRPPTEEGGMKLALGDRGSVTVEYTVLLVIVGLGVAAAMIGVGMPLLAMYRTLLSWLVLSFP